MSPRISSPSSPSTPMHYQVHTVQQQVQEPRQVTIINHHYYIPTPIYQVHEQTPHIPVQPVYYPMIPVHHFDNNNQFYTQNYSMPAPIVPLAYNHNADLSQLLPVDRLSFTQDETSQPRSHPQNSVEGGSDEESEVEGTSGYVGEGSGIQESENKEGSKVKGSRKTRSRAKRRKKGIQLRTLERGNKASTLSP
uniref:Uncharacterized protein n=1 Tax=Meloidogyne hapla TaxID=6305 RepID=A0A1I8C1X2_MELHA